MKTWYKRAIGLLLAMVLLLPAAALADAKSIYSQAEGLMIDGKWGEAAALFEEITSYGDAAKCAVYCRAWEAYEQGNISDAITALHGLGDFKDCIMAAQYFQGVRYELSGDYERAIEAFGKNQFYKDSKERAVDISRHLYDYAVPFSEGLTRVKKDGKWGFIDTTGKVVIPCQYDDASWSFSEGLTCVEKDGKYGFIDTTGKVVIPCQYDDASWSFSEGLARVKKDGKWRYIDTTGKEVIPCQYDNGYSFNKGFVVVVKDMKFGFIDLTGKEVIPCEYDCVEYGEGYFTLIKDGYLTILDKDLNKVF